jgi:hypothetical protein
MAGGTPFHVLLLRALRNSGCRTLRGFRTVRVKNAGIVIVGLPEIAIVALTDFIGECSTAKGFWLSDLLPRTLRTPRRVPHPHVGSIGKEQNTISGKGGPPADL